ncbi:MAG TPA: hypothetical protein VKY59_19265 [Spirillospora sp.]|nr:hypothetical protein [Spirillospora sp.]
MEGLAGLFFVLLALALLGTYLAIRREWFSPTVVAGTSIVACIILMILTALGQGNSALQAIVVGIVVGGLFSGATVAIAWYFHSQELQKRQADDAYYDEQPDEVA